MKAKLRILLVTVVVISGLFTTLHVLHGDVDFQTDSEGGVRAKVRNGEVKPAMRPFPDRTSPHARGQGKNSGHKVIDHALSSETTSLKEANELLLSVVDDSSYVTFDRIDALEHLLNLLKDEEFERLIDLLKRHTAKEESWMAVRILDDSLNRSDEIQIQAARASCLSESVEVREQAGELIEFHETAALSGF